MAFPRQRLRRLRQTENLRKMVRETTLSSDDFIYPLFAVHGKGIKKEIPSMPGNYQQSIDNIVKDAKETYSLGIPAVMLLAYLSIKTNSAQRRMLKRHYPAGNKGY